MKRILKIFIVLIVALSQFSCVSYYETVMKSNDVDVKYKAAFSYFNKGKYKKAAEIFENLVLATQGTPQEDTVNYYTALSNYRYGDYTTAESNFAKFIEVFPRSPFAEESQYLRIKCLYESTYRYELDQTATRKAMMVISEFMYENPTSEFYPTCQAMMKEFMERLDKKSLESAKLYYLMEDYKAAHYALKAVLKENAENQYREEVLYYTVLSSYQFAANSIKAKQKERYLTFIDDYYNFVSEYPESVQKKELDGLFVKVQSYLGKRDKKEEVISAEPKIETEPVENITK
ncbi:MAG: outer membrane protein assembly factor BamD [Bacteroidales bacterium]